MAKFIHVTDVLGVSNSINVDAICRIETPEKGDMVYIHLLDGKCLTLTREQAKTLAATFAKD